MKNKKSVFKGVATALITPFKNGEIDFESLGRLIDFQIDNGAQAICVLGTTGEASTVSENERYDIIAFARRKIAGRVPLIVGSGTNNTEVSLRYSKTALALGADALLLVSPYYNKASARGICEHYLKIAKGVDLPIILYNVPSRTGVSIPISVYKELGGIESIVGIKEASGNFSYLCEILDTCGDFFDVYCGNDDLTLPTLALGGSGVISVCSNIVPCQMAELCNAFFDNNIALARGIQLGLSELIKELFAQVNPIPIKCACSLMGMCENELRLPLCASEREKELMQVLKKYALI